MWITIHGSNAGAMPVRRGPKRVALARVFVIMESNYGTPINRNACAGFMMRVPAYIDKFSN